MKITKTSVAFMRAHPELAPFVVTQFSEGNTVNSGIRRIARDQLGLKVSISREKFILVDPQTAQSQRVWKVRVEERRKGEEEIGLRERSHI